VKEDPDEDVDLPSALKNKQYNSSSSPEDQLRLCGGSGLRKNPYKSNLNMNKTLSFNLPDPS